MHTKKQKAKIKIMLQYSIPADDIGKTHQFYEDNKNRLIELYRISDAITRRKY